MRPLRVAICLLVAILIWTAWPKDVVAQAESVAWPFTLKTGFFHVHTVLSNTVNRQPVSKLADLRGDGDHLFSGDIDEMMIRCAANFVAFSDHGEKLTPGEWLRLGDLAAANSEDRIALRGFEWTKNSYRDPGCNHITIYGTTRLAGAWIENEGTAAENWDGTKCPNLSDIYAWLSLQNEPWVGCFAHPWAGKSHFDNFILPKNERLQNNLALIEVGGGSAPIHQLDLAIGEGYYQKALAVHRVSPVYGMDNEIRPARDGFPQTGVWVPFDQPYTIDCLMNSLISRRTFVRLSGVEEIRLAASVGVDSVGVDPSSLAVMGGQITVASNQLVKWEFSVRHRLPKAVIHLVGIGASGVVDEQRARTANGILEFVPKANAICYYLRVRTGYGTVIGLSAPIWIKRESASTSLASSSRQAAQPASIEEINPVRPPWVAPTNPPVDFCDYPVARLHIIRVSAGRVAMVRFVRHAEWNQAFRVSGNGEIQTAELKTDQTIGYWIKLINRTDKEQFYTLEAFHFRPDRGVWLRTWRARLERKGGLGRKLLYEDGSWDGADRDFDDLSVELVDSKD